MNSHDPKRRCLKIEQVADHRRAHPGEPFAANPSELRPIPRQQPHPRHRWRPAGRRRKQELAGAGAASGRPFRPGERCHWQHPALCRQISACSSRRHSHRWSPACGTSCGKVAGGNWKKGTREIRTTHLKICNIGEHRGKASINSILLGTNHTLDYVIFIESTFFEIMVAASNPGPNFYRDRGVWPQLILPMAVSKLSSSTILTKWKTS